MKRVVIDSVHTLLLNANVTNATHILWWYFGEWHLKEYSDEFLQKMKSEKCIYGLLNIGVMA